MEKGYGGPVWHASVMMMANGERKRSAMTALEGVGDATLGEWTEQHGAIHIRRRLSMREQISTGLQMVDLRGTKEARERILKIIQVAPHVRPVAMAEMNESPNAVVSGEPRTEDKP